ncbi:hypothetical protein F0562_034190 [Nyssa sinensis]|uniref:Uncharacterized protein n=1 Tax=Nyssa sinensis TaxID=561372 RepID=A0A5J5AGI2_9ASTE|nr:hypothetical protein F0562_034190 [Nyssa sinensis]
MGSLGIILKKIQDTVTSMNEEDKRAFSTILRGEKECATIREKEIDRKYGMKLESLILKGTENMGSSHSQIIKVPIS